MVFTFSRPSAMVCASNRTNSSSRILTRRRADIWDERTVKPTTSAKRTVTYGWRLQSSIRSSCENIETEALSLDAMCDGRRLWRMRSTFLLSTSSALLVALSSSVCKNDFRRDRVGR